MYILCIYRADNGASLAFVARNRTKLRAVIDMAKAGDHEWRLFDTSPRGGWCDGSPNAYEFVWDIPKNAAIVQ